LAQLSIFSRSYSKLNLNILLTTRDDSVFEYI